MSNTAAIIVLSKRYSGQGLLSVHTPTHVPKQPLTSSKHAFCMEILSLLLDVDFPSSGKKPVYHKSQRTKATHTHTHTHTLTEGRGQGQLTLFSLLPLHTAAVQPTQRERDRHSPQSVKGSVAHFKNEWGVYSSSSMRV